MRLPEKTVMQCVHCRAWNEEDERRCVRCGRRMHASPLRPSQDTYPLTGATAPALESLQGGRTLPEEAASPAAPVAPPAGYQPWLFRDPSQGPKVVPIPTLTPRPHGGERKPRVQNTGRSQGQRMRASARRAADMQQSLDFHTSAVPEPSLGMEVEAVIYCDAPVALPVHRLMAVAADASMIAIALGLFLAIFYLSGGRIVFTKSSVVLFAAVIGAVVFLYRLLWCLGDGDTPGMRFAGLRLVDFDGRRPVRQQRTVRLAASVLSIVSAGLGLVWALVDEENLTWHDHISKTFPTPG
jgi:uncharacterized RDD family membrane protein YckC